MLRATLTHEWGLLRTSSATWLALGLLVVSVLFGIVNGDRWSNFQRQTLADAHAHESEMLTELVRRLAEPDDYPLDPANANHVGTFTDRVAVLPPAPLAALAVGQSDVAPYHLFVSAKSLASTLIKAAEEIGNPQAYVTGRFDTAFALVVVLPLALLALLFDLVSGERERGTLAMVLAQPIGPGAWVWAKAVLRWALVVSATWIALLAGLFFVGADLRSAATGLFVALAAIALYAAVWTALAVWVAGRGWGSATNALALAAIWVAAIVIVPGVIAAATRAISPVPSRAALVEAERDAETRLSDRGPELLLAYYDANPGTRPAGFDPTARDFLFYTAVQGALQETLEPLLAEYDRALAAQERLARAASVLTPAALLQDALVVVAGTDAARHARFMDQVRIFHQTHRAFFIPRAYAKQPLTVADYDEMPRFVFRESPASVTLIRSAWPLGALFALFLLLAALATARLRRLAAR